MIERHLKPLVEESLEHFPVVTILGAPRGPVSTTAGKARAAARTCDSSARRTYLMNEKSKASP
jgi:hypothetical protein